MFPLSSYCRKIGIFYTIDVPEGFRYPELLFTGWIFPLASSWWLLIIFPWGYPFFSSPDKPSAVAPDFLERRKTYNINITISHACTLTYDEDFNPFKLA